MGQNRIKWIEQIKRHQEFDETKLFFVCVQHFSSTDLKMQGKTYRLNPNAIPTIFPYVFTH